MKNAFRETSIHILRMFVEEPYLPKDETTHEVQRVIDDVRNALSNAGEQVGVWEAIELNAADRALATGFPQLALVFTAKALAVSQLSSEEYKYGLDLLRRETAATALNGMAQIQAKAAREAEAANQRAVETAAAQTLADAQAKAAKDLARAQQKFAIDLRREQDEEALDLAQEHAQEAGFMAAESEREIKKFAAIEAQRAIYQAELEQIVSWSFGSYAVAPTLPPIESFCEIMCRDRAMAAAQLKAHQEKAAERLRLSHAKHAKRLSQFMKAEAEQLKERQRQAAIELAERQTIKAIRKKILEDQIERASAGIPTTEEYSYIALMSQVVVPYRSLTQIKSKYAAHKVEF